jgi:hypothetical protein
LIRTLLSENQIKYETVMKGPDGRIGPVLIVREGPTGLLTSTTRIKLHPENETRLLSIPVADTREQTAAVFKALAKGRQPDPDLTHWHALQTWLATGATAVVIPFAGELAERIPPVSTRLRRDFSTLLALIMSHALLHQETRKLDNQGHIVATVADYTAVRDLVADLISAEVETTVPPAVRETVEAVRALLTKTDLAGDTIPVSQSDLVKHMRLDKAAISRRVAEAVSRGFLDDLSHGQKGRPARINLGGADARRAAASARSRDDQPTAARGRGGRVWYPPLKHPQHINTPGS